MLNSEYFEEELGWIQDDRMRSFAEKYVNLFPDYFSVKPSSSSGKYHPVWANGPEGLRKHTRGVMFFVNGLAEAYCLSPLEQDAALIAAMGHDAVKYGLPVNRHTTHTHPAEGAMFFSRVAKALNSTDLPYYNEIYTAIADHMGKWGQYDKPRDFPNDFPRLSQIVHIADMAASRRGIHFDYLKESLIG